MEAPFKPSQPTPVTALPSCLCPLVHITVLTQRASLRTDVLVVSILHLGYYWLLQCFITLVSVPLNSHQL